MDVRTKNTIMKWGGRAVIGVVSFLTGLFAIHIWDKRCDKATEENRLVGENNFKNSEIYIKDKVLQPAGEAATNAMVQAVSDTTRSLLGKSSR